jgi:hypothetical protein
MRIEGIGHCHTTSFLLVCTRLGGGGGPAVAVLVVEDKDRGLVVGTGRLEVGQEVEPEEVAHAQIKCPHAGWHVEEVNRRQEGPDEHAGLKGREVQ